MPSKKHTLPRSFFINDRAYGDYLRRVLGPEARYMLEGKDPLIGSFSAIQGAKKPWGGINRKNNGIYRTRPVKSNVTLGKHRTLGEYLFERGWKGRVKAQESWHMPGKAHGINYDPRDINTQIRLYQEQWSRAKKSGYGDVFLRMSKNHSDPWIQGMNIEYKGLESIEDLRGALRLGQGNILGRQTDPYFAARDVDSSLSIAAGQGDEHSFVPGFGNPTRNQSMAKLRAEIEEIEKDPFKSELEKTIDINKKNDIYKATYFVPSAEEASGMASYTRSKSGQIEKMWGRYDKSRIDFYSNISLKSYRQDLTPGGLLQESGLDMRNLTEVQARELQKQSEGFLKSINIGEKDSLSDVHKLIAMDEKKRYRNNEKLIDFTRMPIEDRDIFMGKHTISGSKLYISETSQRAEAIDKFGQTKVLRDAVTGEVIPYQHSIIADLTERTSVSKTEYLDTVRNMYQEAVGKGKIADAEKYRTLILDATVDQRAFNPIIKSKEIKVHKTLKEINAAVKNDYNMASSISVARGGKRATSVGYEDIKSTVERLQVGDSVFVGTGQIKNPRKAVVSDLTSLRDASVLLTGQGNKVTTWGKLFDKTMKIDPKMASLPDLFEVSLIRNPNAGSKYALDVVGGKAGVKLGQVSAQLENTIGTKAGKEVISGYAGRAWVRPYISDWAQVKTKKGMKWHPTFALGIWGTSEEAYRLRKGITFAELEEANKVQGLHGESSQNLIGTMMDANDTWIAAELQKRMAEKHPSVSMAALSKAESEAWLGGAGTPKVSTRVRNNYSKALIAGAAVTAGALLLWGASRMRNTAPMTEKDVPENLYGRSAPVPPDRQRMHTPSTRIEQTNNGYATNIEVEAGDNGEIVDHRGMARTMSAMSREALGTGRINTSLHVIDDSSSMDRESTRRSLNQQLSR
jgi:hypothetical protein